jgi:Zn-dependent protease
MLILGIHELGHYYMSKKHNVDASLPFFIPIPPFIGPLGTFGAFISMREPMPSKKALMDIGAAGPVAGFIVAIPVTIIGLYLTGVNPVEPEMDGELMTFIGQPLLFIGLESMIPIPHGASIHPTAFAGWVGLLVTAMNLLPAGQLDGGHIMRALFGNNSKYISYFVVMVLIVLGFLFAGWWIFTFLILMLGTNHPPPLNDISRLSKGRKAIGAFAIVMLIVCFIPIPIQVAEIPDFEVNAVDAEIIAGPGEDVNFTLLLGNMGSDRLTYEIDDNVEFWKADGKYFNTSEMNGTQGDIEVLFAASGWYIEPESPEVSIGGKNRVEYSITVSVPDDAMPGDELEFIIEFSAEENPYVEKSISLRVVIDEISLRYDKITQELKPGTYYDFDVEVKNTGNRIITIGLNASINKTMSKNIRNWDEPVLNSTPFDIGPGDSKFIIFTIKAPDSAGSGETAVITLIAQDVNNPTVFDQTNFEVKVI